MSTKTVLVVDDSKSARYAMRKYLESFGYQVDTADSAEDAFIYLRKKRPELLFIDHIMPGTDGFDAIRSLKQNAQTSSLPVVLCSSNEGEEFLRQARVCGASEVLQKPPSAEQIRSVLDSIHRQQEAAPPPSSPKVQPIRQPEVAIEQAVMKNLREALPAAAASAPPRPVAPAMAAVSSAASSFRLDELREEMEGRMRKITQDLFVQLAEAKAHLAHLDAASRMPRDDTQLRALAREAVEPRIEALARQLEDMGSQLRADLEEMARSQTQRIDQLSQSLHQAVIEEAHAVSERVVMNAAARISEQIAESILRVLKQPIAAQA